MCFVIIIKKILLNIYISYFFAIFLSSFSLLTHFLRYQHCSDSKLVHLIGEGVSVHRFLIGCDFSA